MPQNLEPTIERYLCRFRSTLRSSTIRNKGYILRCFASHLRERHPDLSGLTHLRRHPHIEPWLEHLLYLKPSSRNQYIRTVSIFFDDLIRWQWPEPPPPALLSDEDLAPDEYRLPKPLHPELDQAVQKALIDANTFYSLGLLLLRYTGMRVGEMQSLSLHAMESSGSNSFSLRVPVGKTYSERMIPIDPRSVTLIQRIIEQRGCRLQGPLPSHLSHLLMIDPFGRHIGPQMYTAHIKKLTAHLNLNEPIYCHRLRHTFATEMARAGMPLPALMKLLGHKTPKMTMLYVQVAHTDLRQAYDQALSQLSLMRCVAPPALPALPSPSTPLPHQPLQLISILISCLENQRRDTLDPAQAQQLQRFIKRMRRTGYDLKKLL